MVVGCSKGETDEAIKSFQPFVKAHVKNGVQEVIAYRLGL